MGFKGGLAAFTNAFMGSMKEANEQKRLEAERADQKARQADEDAWRKEQRERERKNLAEADALKSKLADAAKPIDTTAPQHGPVMPGQELPDIKTGSRPRTSDEVLDETAKVYQGHGNPLEAIKLQQAADAERVKRSVQAYNNFYAASQNLAPDQQIKQAIQIFNSDPSLGHIENEKVNPDGTLTMDVFNKKTGQRVTTTMKPNELLTGLRMHYDQAGAMAAKAEAEKRAQNLADAAAKPYELSPGQERWANGKLVSKNNSVTPAEARLQALEMKGAGGGKAEKPVAPAISEVKTDSGNYLYDKNSGAIGTIVPASEGTPGKSSWFGADTPATPPSGTRVEWKTADGQPLPGGPQTLYAQLPVNKQRLSAGGLPTQPKTSTGLPPGLVVGATSKQPDGVYTAMGKQVIIRGGKVTEIK